MTPEEAEFSPAEGAPGDVAKVLLSAARSGLRAVHLVAGDPFGHESVVKEVQAVARTAVPFEVVPGVAQAAGVATYAGVPLTGVRTSADIDDVNSVDFEALAPAAVRGSIALALDAGDLAAVRDGLLAAGVDASTAGRGDRRRHRRDAVHHDVHGGQRRRRGARLHRPGGPDRRRRRHATGTS